MAEPTLADLMTQYVCTCAAVGSPAAAPGRGAHVGVVNAGMRCATAAAAAEIARRFYAAEIKQLQDAVAALAVEGISASALYRQERDEARGWAEHYRDEMFDIVAGEGLAVTGEFGLPWETPD